MGLPCGLAVLEALTQQVVGYWEEDGVEMQFIKSYLLAPQVYLITSIDDMGELLMFVMNCGIFTESLQMFTK